MLSLVIVLYCLYVIKQIFNANISLFCIFQGLPFPPQEQNAIDAVMQYAIHKLNFQPENIIIYAWSIGGYCGTWAAMNYPEVIFYKYF